MFFVSRELVSISLFVCVLYTYNALSANGDTINTKGIRHDYLQKMHITKIFATNLFANIIMLFSTKQKSYKQINHFVYVKIL